MNESKIKGFFSRKTIFGTTVAGAMLFVVVGIVLWGGFNTALEVTNTQTFCISCHEMQENVYAEYQGTAHDTNASGVRATCPDCHVPRPWFYKVARKIRATGELYHWLAGTVDTPEKFDQHRLTLAKRVWQGMKETDSRECRNCHAFETMDLVKQEQRARQQHLNAMELGNTCIDCHKGIAHEPVHNLLTEAEIEELERPNPDHIRPIPASFLGSLARAQAADEDAAREEQEQARYQRERVNEAVQQAVAEYMDTIAQLGSLVTFNNRAVGQQSSGDGSGLDWSAAPTRQITLFYPGQASIEWMLNGREHSGSRAFNVRDRCVDCHEQEVADIGKKIVTGEIPDLEPDVIPGKRGSIPVDVQAMHDDEFLYMRFQWTDGEHAPAPFVEGGKMDPENPIKLAIMLASDDVEYADRAGCWATCHHDLRTMPDAPDESALSKAALLIDTTAGITKYIAESRTEIEVRGRGGKPRGGWNKLKAADEITAELDAGRFMDLLRFQSGNGTSEDGHILEQRLVSGGVGFESWANLDGDRWTVEIQRKLDSDKPGDVTLALDQTYNIGFAIHDDFSNARFHHVSLGYKLAFDDDQAEINAVKR